MVFMVKNYLLNTCTFELYKVGHLYARKNKTTKQSDLIISKLSTKEHNLVTTVKSLAAETFAPGSCHLLFGPSG